MKTIGEKIRDQRLNLGLKQQDLADQAGITIRTVSNYENGAARPRGIQLRKVCAVLQVSEEYLTNPEIDDPTYGLDAAPYVDAVRDQYGAKGALDMQQLLEQNRALFAGGDIPQEDKDLFFNAIMQAYVATKQDAHDRFTPKKYRK